MFQDSKLFIIIFGIIFAFIGLILPALLTVYLKKNEAYPFKLSPIIAMLFLILSIFLFGILPIGGIVYIILILANKELKQKTEVRDAVKRLVGFTLLACGLALFLIGITTNNDDYYYFGDYRVFGSTMKSILIIGGMILSLISVPILTTIEQLKETFNRMISSSNSKIIKVRCSKCQTLNDETAAFCANCGNKLK